MRNKNKPTFSFSEAMFDFIVVAVGTFLFAWLNLPGYFRWIVVGAGRALVITARLLRR